MENERRVEQRRKHPICQVKGCDRLQVFLMTVDVPAEDGEVRSVEIKICPKHEREIVQGGNVDISMGVGERPHTEVHS